MNELLEWKSKQDAICRDLALKAVEADDALKPVRGILADTHADVIVDGDVSAKSWSELVVKLAFQRIAVMRMIERSEIPNDPLHYHQWHQSPAISTRSDILRERIEKEVRQALRDGDPLPTDGSQQNAETERQARHSPDFASVNWFGELYRFTPSQAACVKVLWEAWENETPVVGEAAIQETADVSSKMRSLFGDHPAWDTMIVSPSKGRFSLQEPAREENSPANPD